MATPWSVAVFPSHHPLRPGSHHTHSPLSRALATTQATFQFNSFFKTLIGKEIAVELKNDAALTGEPFVAR